MTGNQKDLARYLGVNKSSVCRAVKAGRVRAEADGSYDFEKCAAQWQSSAAGRTDVAARHATQRGAELPKSQQSPQNATTGQETAAPLEVDAGVANDSRTAAKALLLHFENSSIKLEMALRRGMRFDRSIVKREAAALGAMVRAGVERVIDQAAPRLAAAGNDLERRRILDGEIRRLRWILKRELPRALRRMREHGMGARVGAGEMAQ